MKDTHRNLSRGLELLKLCRNEWMTAREVSVHIKCSEHAAYQRLTTCVNDGFMVSRLRTKTPQCRWRIAPSEFSVAPAWRNDG